MAGTGSGLDGSIGIAREVFPGTAVTPTRFHEFENQSMSVNVLEIDDTSIGRGLYQRSDRVSTVIIGGGGAVPMPFMNKGMGVLLRAALGGAVFSWPGSTNAARVLTCDTNPTADDTCTIGTTVYTFKASVSTTAYQVAIGATLADSLRNLAAAINQSQGAGRWYGSLTPAHPTVSATYTATTLTATDKMGRGASATDATTETFTAAGNVWAGVALTGGVDGTDTRYRQTFTPHARGLRGESLTVQANVPDSEGFDQPFTFPGSKVIAATLGIALDGYLMFTPTFDAKTAEVATALATPSYTSGMSMYPFNLVAVTVGGSAVDISAADVTWTNAVDVARRFLGNTKKEPLANARFGVAGNLAGEFHNRDAYDAWVAGTVLPITIIATGATMAGSASPYLMSLTLPACKYTGSAPQVGGPAIIQQPRPFRVLDNGSDPVYTLLYDTLDAAF